MKECMTFFSLNDVKGLVIIEKVIRSGSKVKTVEQK